MTGSISTTHRQIFLEDPGNTDLSQQNAKHLSPCASRTITGRIFAASRFTYGGGISDPAAGGGGVSAQRHGGQNMQLEYRVSLVGDFKKPRHRKGLQGYREKLVYR